MGEILDAGSAAAWRVWLDEHGTTADEVWLVVPHARSGRPGPTHAEAVEEALCVGWIDGLSRGHDGTSRLQRFTPRSARSAWSTINRAAVERLTAQGRMAPAGLAAVEAAQRSGMWTLLADAQAGIVPEDLRSALDADPAAATGWDTLRPSARRAHLEALARAKRPDTRARKIDAALSDARTSDARTSGG